MSCSIASFQPALRLHSLTCSAVVFSVCRDAQLESSADGVAKGSRRRRVRRSPYNMRNLLLVLFTMSCVIMMLYLFIWVSSSPTMADMSRTSTQSGSSIDSSSLQHAATQAAVAGSSGPAAGGVQQPAAAVAPVKQPEGVVGAVTGAGAGLASQAAGSIAGGVGLQAASGAAEAAGRAAAGH
jgi:hypothetical protein